MTHIHYYWFIKYWRFFDKIANRQSLLLTNISLDTVCDNVSSHSISVYDEDRGIHYL